jgi:hypothetical protein
LGVKSDRGGEALQAVRREAAVILRALVGEEYVVIFPEPSLVLGTLGRLSRGDGFVSQYRYGYDLEVCLPGLNVVLFDFEAR